MQDFVGQKVQVVGDVSIEVPFMCYIDATVDLKPLIGLMRNAPYDWVISVEVVDIWKKRCRDMNILEDILYGNDSL